MKVAAIIPAYNEEQTIGSVVQVVRRVPEVNEVIVVSDGSTDATARNAAQAGARVIELAENVGKGGALTAGIAATDAEVLLFLDADLVGLREDHVYSLINPVLQGEAQAVIGILDRGRLATDLAQKFAPRLSGQRCLRRELLDGLHHLEMTRFGAEVALNRHLRAQGVEEKMVVLEDLTHVMKEEKRGLVRGIASRMKMYWEIARVWIRGNP
ncbi:MAG: hypothetical protein PWQ31_1438 [Eubacteriales bacterium]|nr:hypothetical protein [Eubacteriales bacterium]